MAHQKAREGHHRSNANYRQREEQGHHRREAFHKSLARPNLRNAFLQSAAFIAVVIENDMPRKRCSYLMLAHNGSFLNNVVWLNQYIGHETYSPATMNPSNTLLALRP